MDKKLLKQQIYLLAAVSDSSNITKTEHDILIGIIWAYDYAIKHDTLHNRRFVRQMLKDMAEIELVARITYVGYLSDTCFGIMEAIDGLRYNRLCVYATLDNNDEIKLSSSWLFLLNKYASRLRGLRKSADKYRKKKSDEELSAILDKWKKYDN